MSEKLRIQKIAAAIALGMYVDEPCRICGERITVEQVGDAVFAGYSKDNMSRGAHKACWDKQIPQEQWVKQ